MRTTTLRNRDIIQLKVQWKHFGPKQSTWEVEKDLKEKYPFLQYPQDHVEASVSLKGREM